jgi:imidazole glycerol-phosphate synthase subunit HisF
MLKKRLIFTLLYENGNFVISRNFRLQKVGDAEWLKCNYNFIESSKYIDELVVLDVTRGKKNRKQFMEILQKIRSFVFIPIAVGGGIDSVDDGLEILANGADKIVINSIISSKPEIVKELVENIGSQSIVGGIDYKLCDRKYFPFINNGTDKCCIDIFNYAKTIQSFGVGEIYVNSISRDGTGQGYDIELMKKMIASVNIPLICAGGAGKKEHFYELLSHENIRSVATAHLFNFIGDGLKLSREFLIAKNIGLAEW